jgi:hypothetical protein
MEAAYKSLDEVTSMICDAYDELIAPKRIWRNNDNKLYLIFRACAAGIRLVFNIALALRWRFDPQRCSEDDLLSAAKLVGTEFQKGSGSAVRITVSNAHTLEARTLAAGVYNYTSVSGMVFSFNLTADVEFASGASNAVTAVSREKGRYSVGDNSSIKLFRSDGFSIDKAFKFSCEENSGLLGYPDEDLLSFRQRVLSSANRQDHLKELELKIKSLPDIFECGLTFNPDRFPAEYDGVTLAPLELLVTITGTPSDKLAELVVKDTQYSTHMTDPANVVFYRNDQYVNGKYPVYFRYHAKADFALEIEYQYSSQKLKKAQVEAEFNRLLSGYKNAVVHTDMIRELDIYGRLAAAGLPDVTPLAVSIVADGNRLPYFTIPATRTPNLTAITYESLDLMGEEA